MYRIFQAFVDRLTESADADALRQGMAETVNSLDLCCFAYLSVSPDPKIVPQLISTYPSNWTAHYVQHHYERFDPVIIRALEQPLPFEWGLGVGPDQCVPNPSVSYLKRPLGLVSDTDSQYQFTTRAALSPR
ncbi:hypothetical protein ACVWWR_005344 [Bradyrhizobium sp. LM3.2]